MLLVVKFCSGLVNMNVDIKRHSEDDKKVRRSKTVYEFDPLCKRTLTVAHL